MLIFMTVSEGAAAAAQPRRCCSQGVTLCAISVPRSSGEDVAQARLCLSNCRFLPCHTIQELESSVEGWTDDLTSLFLLRDSLEGVVSTDDITVLQERLRLLQCQWEEVCHQVQSHSSHMNCLFFPFLVLKKVN